MPTHVLHSEASQDAGLVADIDWATGLVRMHMTLSEWRAIRDVAPEHLDDNGRYVLEVFTHEFVHLLHMATTGFAYELSVRLFTKVAEALAQGDHTLDDVYEAHTQYAAELEPEFRHLEEPGPGGVCALDLLESTAFLVQKRMHYQGLGPQVYERMLDEQAAAASYRRAYDLAADILAEDALDQLPHAAGLALMTREPATVFLPLLETFRDEGSRLGVHRTHEAGLRLLNRRFPSLLLGHALERFEAGVIHPVLNPIMLGFNDLAHEGQLLPEVMLARPHTIGREVADLLVGPMLFRPEPGMWVAPMWVPDAWQGRVGDDRLLEPGFLRLCCAVSKLVVMDIEPAPLQQPTSRPDSAGHNVPVIARDWVLSAENRTAATAARLASNLAQIEQDPIKARMLRGTVSLTVPGEEHPGSPYLDSAVRRYMYDLYDRIPHLLYYLTDVTEAGTLLGCAAAHSPDEAVSEGPNGSILVALEPGTVQWLTARLQAAAIFAHRVGDHPRVLLGHLRDVDTWLRGLLIQVVLDPDLREVSRASLRSERAE